MIARIKRWWRRTNEHYRERQELLLEADRTLRGMGATLNFDEILLLCLRVGVLDLKNAQVLIGSPPTMMPGQEARQGPDRVLH